MKGKIMPSVQQQLQTISKTLSDLVYYEFDVSEDMTDAIVYESLRDQVNTQIKEIIERAKRE